MNYALIGNTILLYLKIRVIRVISVRISCKNTEYIVHLLNTNLSNLTKNKREGL